MSCTLFRMLALVFSMCSAFFALRARSPHPLASSCCSTLQSKPATVLMCITSSFPHSLQSSSSTFNRLLCPTVHIGIHLDFLELLLILVLRVLGKSASSSKSSTFLIRQPKDCADSDDGCHCCPRKLVRSSAVDRSFGSHFVLLEKTTLLAVLVDHPHSAHGPTHTERPDLVLQTKKSVDSPKILVCFRACPR